MWFNANAVVAFLIAAGGVSAGQRDRAATPPGEMSQISGSVVTDTSTPSPVRGAVVSLSSPELPGGRAVLSDANGRFMFRELPAGRYTLTVAKAPFITAAFGAKRPGGAGVPLTLVAGQQPSDVTIRLARGAVIAGNVRDARGDALPGAGVAILRLDQRAGDGSAVVVQSTVTDDRGAYRFFGLMPGKYAIVSPRPALSGEMSRPSSQDVDSTLADLQTRFGRSGIVPAAPPRRAGETNPQRWPVVAPAPIFYPGTASAADATSINVSVGEERTGVDFAVSLVPTSSIEGTVVHPEGSPASVQLVITPADSLLPLLAMLTPVLTEPPDQNGKFTYTSVAPGTYTITARSTSGAPLGPTATGRGGTAGGGSTPIAPTATPGRMLWASADVTVTGSDVAGVTLSLQPALRFSGRIAFDPGAADPPADLSKLTVRLISTKSRGSSAIGRTAFGTIPIPPAQVRTDGTFEVGGVMSGSYRVSILGAPSEWWLRSAVVGGRDVLDDALEVGRGSSTDIAGATLTLTDRHSELAGTLQTPAGSAAIEYFVVVLPANRELWVPQSRRIRSTRPASDGRFAFADLPAGDYLLAALTDLEPADLEDRAFLEQLVAAAVKVALGEGERKMQDLRIGR
jgi:carboxypeptidase family protein